MNTISVVSSHQPDFLLSLPVFNSKSIWTHLSDRLTASEGIYDALKVGEYAIEWFKHLPQQVFQSSHLGQAKQVFSHAATILGAFGLVKQIGDTVISISLFGRLVTKTTSYSEIDVIARDAGRNVLDFTCMASDVANNFHEAGWVNLGSAAPISSGIFFGTDIVGHGIDLAGQVCQISARNVQRQAGDISPHTKINFIYKDILSSMEIVKNVACISGSIIGLASLILGGPVFISVIGLILSSTWIVSKIVSHFYNEMVVKDHSRSCHMNIR